MCLQSWNECLTFHIFLFALTDFQWSSCLIQVAQIIVAHLRSS
jgi:hypothetical protein